MGKYDRFIVKPANLPPVEVNKDEGWYMKFRTFLTAKDTGSHSMMCFHAVSGTNATVHAKHLHEVSEEIFYVLRGRAAFGWDDEEYEIKAGDVIYVPIGVVHWCRTLGDAEPYEAIGFYTNAGSVAETIYKYVGEPTEEDMKVK